VTNHVLGDFAKSDQDWLAPMLDAIASEAPYLVEPDGNRFATAVAQKLAPLKKEVTAKPDPGNERNQPAPALTPEKTNNAFTDALKKLLGDKE